MADAEDGNYGALAGFYAQSALNTAAGYAMNRQSGLGAATSGCSCCFAGDTPVAVEDGTVPIDHIKVGQRVYSRDPKTGKIKLKRVSHVMVVHGKPLYELVTEGVDHVQERTEVTDNHPYWVKGQGWVESAKLEPGMILDSLHQGELSVVGVKLLGLTKTTYNLTVADYHTFYAGKQLVYVHNQCACKAVPRISPGSLPAAEEAAVLNTLGHIDAGTNPAAPLSKKWGTQFENRAGDLPGAKGKASPYLEYRVAPPTGTNGAGTNRIVVNSKDGNVYYTWTHYGDTAKPAFVQIR